MEPCQIVDLYEFGYSIPEIAALVGLSRSTVRYHISRSGQLRSRAEGVRAAAAEGRLGSGLRGKRRVFTDQHKERIRSARLSYGEKHAVGLSLKPSGYIEITRGPEKGRSQHRVIAEQILGRPLEPGEHVHHIDGDRSNNDPANLQVMTAAEHASLHAKAHVINRRRNQNGTWN
jgi:DNA-binding transcriptional MerR regulator